MYMYDICEHTYHICDICIMCTACPVARLIGESIDALVGWKWYHHGAQRVKNLRRRESLVFDVVCY